MEAILSVAPEEAKRFHKTHDGHTFILDALLCQTRLGTVSLDLEHAHEQAASCRLASEIFYHATRCTAVDKSAHFKILDEFDDLLSQRVRSDWPRILIKETSPIPFIDRITEDHHFDFLAFAVAAGMNEYLQHRLQIDPRVFIKRKGAPLLLFCLSGRDDHAIRRLLLQHPRNTGRPSDGKSAALRIDGGTDQRA